MGDDHDANFLDEDSATVVGLDAEDVRSAVGSVPDATRRGATDASVSSPKDKPAIKVPGTGQEYFPETLSTTAAI